MRRLFLVLAAVAPLAASATSPDDAWWWWSQDRDHGYVAISAPLSTAGCFASPYTSGNLTLTITRASTANSSDNSQSCASGEATIESDGLSSWHAATNYVSNPGTHPKTGESLASITAGAVPALVWGEGSGTITIAAGTATLSANTCATPVTLPATCSITVSATGSPTITTTGAMTHVQVEVQVGANATYPSPKILGGAAPLTRAGPLHNATTAISALNLYQTNRWCAAITAKPYRNWTYSGLNATMWSFGNTSSASNSASLAMSSAGLNFVINDAAVAANSVVWTLAGAQFTPNSAHRFVACNSGGTPILCVNGAQVSTTTTIGGTGLWDGNPVTSTIGNNVASIRQWDGDLSNFKLCKGATRCSDCP